MKLRLVRQHHFQKSTIGSLFVDDKFHCNTLEDVVRPVKIDNETAIPAGTYEVVVNFSDRFKRPMPLLLGVPNYKGVRIHTGNTDANTEGCILVGTWDGKQENWISKSAIAFGTLFPLLEKACRVGKVMIEITDEHY